MDRECVGRKTYFKSKSQKKKKGRNNKNRSDKLGIAYIAYI